MKKIQFVVLLMVFVSAISALAIPPTTSKVDDLAGNSWKFSKVSSDDPSTAHYLTVMYGEAEYRFAENHTYTGTFCGISLSGTWDISGNTLFLNKGTYKEEKYPLITSSDNHFVLQVTEKGKKATLEFVKQ